LFDLADRYIVAGVRIVVDPNHFDANPDPTCLFDADPDPSFHFGADPDPSFQIKAQNIEKVLK
jgi:hypothetical protein